VGYALLPHWARKPTQQAHGQHHLLLLLLLPLLLLLLQVFDTPSDHVTRDYREGLAQLGDLRFRVVDTSGLEPAAAAHSLQVGSRSFCEGGRWQLQVPGPWVQHQHQQEYWHVGYAVCYNE
jgi:hypothetical protein